MEESPTVWAAWHRLHHHSADNRARSAQPAEDFCGVTSAGSDQESTMRVRSRLRSAVCAGFGERPLYAWLERSDNWIKVGITVLGNFLCAGFCPRSCGVATRRKQSQFGSSLVIWGAARRTVLVWHITWSVNSVTHLWGYRNYQRRTTVATTAGRLCSLRRGLAQQSSRRPRLGATRAHWWEFDLAWLSIRMFARLGLATSVCLPSPNLAETFKLRAKSTPTLR